MKPETTRTINDTPHSQHLNMAIELSNETWKLGFTIGFGQAPRLRDVRARDLTALTKEIRMAKGRFGLAEAAPVLSCYEAGRDGFWLHRFLQTLGITNLVVDSASIEVNRRKRRAKTDRMDVGKLLTMLIRYDQGEKKVWSIVHVPSPEDEDQRQLHRELMALKAEQTHYINQIKGLLASQGVALPFQKDFLSRLETVRLWDGSPLPAALHARLKRDYERSQLVKKQIAQLELERALCDYNHETIPSNNLVCRAEEKTDGRRSERGSTGRDAENRSGRQSETAAIHWGIQAAHPA